MSRKISLEIKPIEGGLNKFIAFVGNKKVISGSANKERAWSGEVDDKVHLRVLVFGIENAKYEVTIDLPGTADDQKIVFKLNSGFHEAEFTI